MSVFAGIFEAADRIIDTVLGDAVRIEPMAGGRVSAARADTARAVKTVVGVYTAAPTTRRLFEDRRTGTTAVGSTDVQAVVYTVELRPEVVASLGYRINEGDIIALPVHAAPNRFKVSQTNPDDLGGVVLNLTVESDQ